MDIENALFTVELLDGRKITFDDDVIFFQASKIDIVKGVNKIITLCLDGNTMINIENVVSIRLANDVERNNYELFHPKDGDKPCT